jgi:murein L,D-transpeptidase YcbB/YkuD
VRIERPTELATLLLERQGWSRERLESHIATGDTETIFLTEPLALRLVYWTATVDDSGAVHFANDIYGRDAALLTALDAVP